MRNIPGNPRAAAALAFILAMTAIFPAHADNGRGRDRGDREWRAHEEHVRRYWARPRYVPEPSVIYAPPVVYAPPPVYAEPGINLIIPLHIR
jgi:hypothetical protein